MIFALMLFGNSLKCLCIDFAYGFFSKIGSKIGINKSIQSVEIKVSYSLRLGFYCFNFNPKFQETVFGFYQEIISLKSNAPLGRYKSPLL